MEESVVGIRDLKQNASQVVARVRAGDSLVVTDRGVPVARIIPIGDLSWDERVEMGQASAPSIGIDEVVASIPDEEPTSELSDTLAALREDNRP
jgi:prevent-host-death family protein